MPYVVLTVDLNNVAQPQRDIFNEELSKAYWSKQQLTTIWQKRFPAGVTATLAINQAKQDVKAAVTAARIENYEAGAVFSQNEMFQWRAPPYGLSRLRGLLDSGP